MTTPPDPAVLAERIDGLGQRFTGVEQRLGGLATKDEIVALIQGRDQLTATQFAALTEDVRNLTVALATERAERVAADEKERIEREGGDRENENRAGRARTFALSAIGTAVAILGAVILLINNLGGGVT